MASMKPGVSPEDILRELQQQARILWGDRRAEEIEPSLEQTARQLVDVSRNLPFPEVEPGFYQ